MPFTVYVRTDGQAIQQYDLRTKQAAVTVACAFMKQGIKVERIELPNGRKLDAEEIRALNGEL